MSCWTATKLPCSPELLRGPSQGEAAAFASWRHWVEVEKMRLEAIRENEICAAAEIVSEGSEGRWLREQRALMGITSPSERTRDRRRSIGSPSASSPGLGSPLGSRGSDTAKWSASRQRPQLETIGSVSLRDHDFAAECVLLRRPATRPIGRCAPTLGPAQVETRA